MSNGIESLKRIVKANIFYKEGKHIGNVLKNSGKVKLDKSWFLVLSYNKKGWYQLHQFPLVLPNPALLKWEFTTKNEAKSSRRLIASDSEGVLFEWYAESGGQLKYYPFAKGAEWNSTLFQLEPLNNTSDYGILSKAQVYFPEKWKAISKEN